MKKTLVFLTLLAFLFSPPYYVKMMTTTGMNVKVIFTEDLTAIDTREVTEGTVLKVMRGKRGFSFLRN